MEARLTEALPAGEGWQYEPKWDGFRALARRAGATIELVSKSGRPLGRYFPDVVEVLGGLQETQFTVDGELVIPVADRLSFAALQARLHPAAGRVARLSREAPAQYILFDCLSRGGREMASAPLDDRRRALEGFHARAGDTRLILSPATRDRAIAVEWLARSGGSLDGVVAKRTDEAYRPGERAMIKVKQFRTADCVIGGYRTNAAGDVASLLLGLYDGEGRLDHVGFTAAFARTDRAALKTVLAPYAGGEGFTGGRPGGPSRWNGGVEKPWIPMRPGLVAEVIYDQVSGGRFRHGTKFHRWRPDKAPYQCDRSQLVSELGPDALGRLLRV